MALGVTSSLPTVNSAKKSYLHASRSASISISPTTSDHIRYDFINSISGSDVSLDTTTTYTTTANVASIGRFTLKAGRTYKMQGAVFAAGSSAALGAVQWYDATNSVSLGTVGAIIAASVAAAGGDNQTAFAIFTPTTDVYVELRFSAVSDITSLNVSSSGNSYAYIETVEAVIEKTYSAPSYAWLDTANGNGSTKTNQVKFTNAITNGTDLTITQSAVNGDKITVNTTGGYIVEAQALFTNANGSVSPRLSVSKNTNDAGTTDPSSADINGSILRFWFGVSASAVGDGTAMSGVFTLNAGDFLYVHSPASTGAAQVPAHLWYFKVTRLW